MKIMKKTIVALAFAGALASTANAAQIALGNFDLNTGAFLALATSTGTAIPNNAGFVTTGAFSTFSDAQIMSGVSSQANFAALLADFKAFGTGGRFGGSGAFDSPGLYVFDNAAPVAGGDNFAGKTIYTVATSAATLNGATEIFIYKHAPTYMPDAPLFTANANISTGPGSIILGTPGTVTTGAGAVGGAFMVRVVPEPSAGLLALVGCVMLARRKR